MVVLVRRYKLEYEEEMIDRGGDTCVINYRNCTVH